MPAAVAPPEPYTTHTGEVLSADGTRSAAVARWRAGEDGAFVLDFYLPAAEGGAWLAPGARVRLDLRGPGARAGEGIVAEELAGDLGWVAGCVAVRRVVRLDGAGAGGAP